MNRADVLQKMMARSPLVQTLGMRYELDGEEMTSVLPFQDKLIGNVTIKALHGGAMATFLEMTAMAQLYLASDVATTPRTINVTIDYLRQGHARDLYAHASVVKLGRRMASVHAEAWQESRDKPVATLLGHFLVSRD